MENSLKNKRTAGTEGEKIAEEYLKAYGYLVIAKNFRYKRLGEIDLIGRDKGYLCFIEVKTRSTLEYGLPIEAVNYRKQENIKKLANIYICKNNLFNADIRFDVVEVYVRKEKDSMNVEKINLIKNAF